MLTNQERKGIIIAVLSLLVAVVTYGFLESTGAIENKNHKFSGAIAGFLITAYLLHRIYGSSSSGKSKEMESRISPVASNAKVDTQEEAMYHQKEQCQGEETKMPILETLSTVLNSAVAASVAKFLSEKIVEYIRDKYGNSPPEEMVKLKKEIESLKNQLETKDREEITAAQVEGLKQTIIQIEQNRGLLPPVIISGNAFQRWSEKEELSVVDQALIAKRQLEVLIDKAHELGIGDQKRFQLQIKGSQRAVCLYWFKDRQRGKGTNRDSSGNYYK